MTRRRIFAAVFCLMAIIAAGLIIMLRNSVHRNDPPDPGTPAPDPHKGTFSCEYGTMTFNGDGKSISISVTPELAELTGLPEGDSSGTYVFLSGDLPPHGSVDVRYDVAHELEINAGNVSVVLNIGIASQDGKTYTVGYYTVTDSSIPIVLEKNGKNVTADFKKQ